MFQVGVKIIHTPFFRNGGVKMLKTILMVIYVIVCIVLAIVVLSQEGKDASLTSSISGAGGGFDNSYWSKNKGSSKQEILKKITAVLTVLFFVLALLLDSKLFN